MRGNRSFSVLLAAVLLLGGVVFVRDVRQLLADELPAPVLSAEAKLTIREAQIAALQSKQQMAEFMAQIQAQVDSMPEYRKLKSAAQAAAEGYARAIRQALAAAKCENCELDPSSLLLRRPEQSGAKSAK